VCVESAVYHPVILPSRARHPVAHRAHGAMRQSGRHRSGTRGIGAAIVGLAAGVLMLL
jgi:hypothetical protein